MTSDDPFPASIFDEWADFYDADTRRDTFPFTGYAQVIETVVRLAETRAGMRVLDVGTGTGALAERFAALGCAVTATDFSSAMLTLARAHLPQVTFLLADLRQPLPAALEGLRFDRIVSGYVFHHFDLAEKVAIVFRLAERLAPDGQMLIGDISFPDQSALEAVKHASGENWEEELYWLACEALPALRDAGFTVEYTQVSNCAGVYRLQK